MARKSKAIEADFDTVGKKILALHKKHSTALAVRPVKVVVSSSTLNDLEEEIANWGKLVVESEKKIKAWKGGKLTEPAHVKFIGDTKDRKTKDIPQFAKMLSELKLAAAKAKVSAQYEQVVSSQIEGATKKLDLAKKLIDSDVTKAAKVQGAGYGALKNCQADLFNSVKGIKRYATDAVKTVNGSSSLVSSVVSDTGIKKLIVSLRKKYEMISGALDLLNVKIDAYYDNIENTEPESSSSDREYLKNLKTSVTNYNSVLKYAKARLGIVNQELKKLKALKKVIDQTIESNADAAVRGVALSYNTMKDAYNEGDGHIQAKIRTGDSEFVVEREKFGITTADVAKNLAPIMDRAFSVNFQTKKAFGKGTVTLKKFLKELIDKFGNDSAAKLLKTMG